jgi:hypothetical protein
MTGDFVKKLVPFIITLLVVAGGVGVYLLTKKDDSSKNSTDSSISSNSNQNNTVNKYGDACKVFTKEAVAAAFGGTFGEAEQDISVSSSDGLEGSACKFDQDDDGTTAGMTQALTVSVNVNNYKNNASAEDFMKQTQGSTEVDGETIFNFTDAPNIGDSAFFVKGTSELSEKVETMNIRVGKQIIVLNATRLAGIDRPVVQEGMKTLAKNL